MKIRPVRSELFHADRRNEGGPNRHIHDGAKIRFSQFCERAKNTTNFFFPAVSYGRETLSFTLRKERGLGVFGNRVLTKLCGTKRKEGKGG